MYGYISDMHYGPNRPKTNYVAPEFGRGRFFLIVFAAAVLSSFSMCFLVLGNSYSDTGIDILSLLLMVWELLPFFAGAALAVLVSVRGRTSYFFSCLLLVANWLFTYFAYVYTIDPFAPFFVPFALIFFLLIALAMIGPLISKNEGAG